jgi:aspartyl-tRNA(Asn)/glutamyl-tRNA(Gln) amidotransferase subunit C
MIGKKDLEYLGELARIEIFSQDEEKFLWDLEKILSYFEELKEVNTDGVPGMAGGTFSKNIFRADEEESVRLPGGLAVEQFPEKKDGFLKIPPVFE